MMKPGSQRHPTIEALKYRIARDPLSRAFLQLAEEYRKEGRHQEAIDVCLEGLQRHPTYHTARISLGRTYMEAGDLENARRAFVEVLDLQPENHLAAKLLAEIQKKLGDRAGAAATYRSILAYYPTDREVVSLLEEALRPESATPAPASAPSLQPRPVIRPPAAPAAVAAPVHTPAMRPAAQTGIPSAPGRVAVGRPADPSPDFRAEDFGAAMPPSREVARPAVIGAAPAWPGPSPDEPAAPPGDDALQTNTLAELYLRQGLVDRAIEVYRGMLRVDPANQKAARRLHELAPAEGRSGEAAPGVEVAPRTQPAAATRPDGKDHRDTIRRLERWLAKVSHAAAKGAPLR